jgi:peptide/nickel transport system substrate-binding protein
MKNQKVMYMIFVLSTVLALTFTVIAAGTAQAISKNVLSVAIISDPDDTDPRSGYDNFAQSVLYHMYEALTYYNRPGSKEEIGPWLATSWESNKDKTQWTFHLRKGVKFHDGTDFNAAAVKYTIENTVAEKMAPAWIYSPIKSIEVVDEHTIKFTCKAPAQLDLILSSGFGAWMISPSATNTVKWFNAGNSSGTGPYKFASRVPGTRIIMGHHKDYWGGWEEGQFTSIIFDIISDATVREQMLRSGDIDVAYELNHDSIESLKQAPGVAVHIEPVFQTYFLEVNFKRPLLDNLKVRQALTHSFPYKTVMAGVFGGRGTRASGLIPQNMWGANPDLAVAQDLGKAKKLLAEAGHPNGGFTLELWAQEGNALYKNIGELWQPELAKLGIKLDIRVLSFNTITTKAENDPEHAFDLMGQDWYPTYVTPTDFFYSVFHTGEFFNFGHYSNPAFDDLVLKADDLTASDRAGSIELFKQAGKMLADDVGAIFMFDAPQIFTIRDDLKGFEFSPGYTAAFPYYKLKRKK